MTGSPRFARRPAMGISVSLALLVAALPAWAASSFSLDNVTIDTGGATWRAERLDVTDSALSRDEMLALLSAKDGPPSQRFARLNAARIAAPQLVSSQASGGATQRITYRDLVLEDVGAGRVARIRAAGATIAVTGAQSGDISGTAGAIGLDGVDLPALAHIVAEGRADPDEPARVLAAAGRLDALDLDLGGGARAHVDAIAFRDVGGRALAVPTASLVDLTPKPDAPPPSPERRQALTALLADLLTSQSIGALEATNVATQSAAGAATRIAKVSLTGLAAGRVGRLGLENLAVDGKTSGVFSLRQAALSGLDLTPVLDATPGAASSFRSARFDRIELDGFATRAGAAGAQPVAVELAHAAIEARDWRERAPQSVSIALDGFAFDLPADDPRARPLLDLGYKRLILSLTTDAAYDGPKNELALPRFALTGPDIGAIRLSALLSNVRPDLLGPDPERTRAALAGSLFRHAAGMAMDAGLLGRAIEAQARRENATPAAIRARWAGSARAFVTSVLSGNPDRGAVADAAERFVRQGGSLTIEADAPGGIGLIDVMLAGGWQAALAKLRLTAKVE